MSASTLLVRGADEALPAKTFFDGLRARLAGGARAVTLYGQPGDDAETLLLTAVLEEGGALTVLRTDLLRAKGFHALTRDFPALHVFEREIFEQHGVKPHDHPWLKPVRFPSGVREARDAYPFYGIEGKEVHQVAVGPIHAGVIEPGHFRFMCLGEQVHHLEIHLGYQHRGVEALLLRRDPLTLTPLVESVAGDSSIAHAWAYADALEALAGMQAAGGPNVSRGVGLELERIGMHLAGLSGLATDIAFLQGAATYGRLRTTVINTTMLVCGSRFGRGWVRPGAVRFGWDEAKAQTIASNLDLVARDVAEVNELFLSAASVRHRLQGVGVVSPASAAEIGLVGMAARASGVDVDVRTRLGGEPYASAPVESVVEASGDCWARGLVRIREIDRSIAWLKAILERHPSLATERTPFRALAPGMLAVGVREGWRGEVVHAIETDAAGRLRSYRVQDPSLRNWHGLALAVRENAISDFPICNKSFDLSYCGNDL